MPVEATCFQGVVVPALSSQNRPRTAVYHGRFKTWLVHTRVMYPYVIRVRAQTRAVCLYPSGLGTFASDSSSYAPSVFH